MAVADLDPVWPGIVADDLNPQSDGEWFAAFDAAEMVGAAHLVRVGSDELFDDLWVRPDRRRTGVGRVLVTEMQKLRQNLWLIADPDGVAYYEKFGFQVEKTLPSAIAKRYEALGLWPGHLDHLHIAMRWKRD
ncbi:MAG TPA: GNAT family N-acetyltransferase [Candidatus Thermoplasmatota archaeon]